MRWHVFLVLAGACLWPIGVAIGSLFGGYRPPRIGWRGLIVSWLGNLCAQTGAYGVVLWAPALFVPVLRASRAEAAKAMIGVAIAGVVGRFAFSWLSERIGRRPPGGLMGFGAALFVMLAAICHADMVFGVSVFWLLLICVAFFSTAGSRWSDRMRGSVAVATAHLRHGQRVWVRQVRQDHRPAGAGAGGGRFRRGEAGGPPWGRRWGRSSRRSCT